MSHSRTLALVGAAALLLVSAAPVGAQDEATTDGAMDMEALSIEVGGVEYAYTGLPTSLPAGTELTFRNDGAELHELIVARIADETTESLEELLAMGDAAIAEGKVEIIGEGPLIANPGEVAEGALSLVREGDYVAICFVPQGLVPEQLEEWGVTEDMPPEEWPAEAQAVLASPPHMAAGMIQEFTVTAEGTEVGPLPEAASADESAPEGEGAASE